MAYTTEDLLRLIKQKAFLPTAQITFQDTDLLDMASSRIKDKILPLVLRTREEFYVTSQDTVLTTPGQRVDIPIRAVGLAVREISLVQGNTEYNLTRYSIEDLPNISNSGSVYGFYLQGNQICFVGNMTGTVRIYYCARPGDLIRINRASRVTEISGTAITVTALQPAWSTGAKIDLIKADPGFDTLSASAIITSTSGTTILNIAEVPSRLQVGDWVTTENLSPVAQIPVEFYSYLAQLVAVDLLEALGDTEAKKSAQDRLQELQADALNLISPRVQGEPKKIVPPYNRGYTSWNWRF